MRNLYKSARAFAYRYMHRYPGAKPDDLRAAALAYVNTLDLGERQTRNAERVVEEAMGHVSYIVSTGRIEKVMTMPQARPPENEIVDIYREEMCDYNDAMAYYERRVEAFSSQHPPAGESN